MDSHGSGGGTEGGVIKKRTVGEVISDPLCVSSSRMVRAFSVQL